MWIRFLLIACVSTMVGCQKMTPEEEIQAHKAIMEVVGNSFKKGFAEILLQQDVLLDGVKRCNSIEPVIIRSFLIDELSSTDGLFNDFISAYPPLLYKNNYPQKIRRFIHFKNSYSYETDTALKKKAEDYFNQLKKNHKIAKNDEDKAVALAQVSNIMVCINSKILLGIAGLDDELSSIAQDLIIEYIEDMGRSAKEELEKLNNL
jgi:hypothetical protein